MNVKATRVKSLFENPQPGHFKFSSSVDESTRYINFVCPCGCGDIAGIQVKGPKAWEWDGNEDQPTCKPSIQRLDGCKWHGFLTAGEFCPC